MKKPKKAIKPDHNSAIVAAIGVATGTPKPKGEDLISDPKLKAAFIAAKKAAAKKKR